MTLLESIVSLIASVFAILGGLIWFARYIGKKLDNWSENLIENSHVIKELTSRVIRLEEAIGHDSSTGN